MQHTSHLMMIRPFRFGFNEQTAVNNRFQSRSANGNVSAMAQQQFDSLAALLRANDIDVTVIQDSESPDTPDAIFPNNWISFHDTGKVYCYPMFAPNRRQERKPEVLEMIRQKFTVHDIIDLSAYENEGKFLEGTGSMVLDRDCGIAYACLSPRTDAALLKKFCSLEQLEPVTFSSLDENNEPVYHTNVMMCVADRYVVICMDSIRDEADKKKVHSSIERSGKEIIEISCRQMAHFAGNMLQVHNAHHEVFVIMSGQAYRSLTAAQLAKLESFNNILHSDLSTIEINGGGSARCMIAEIFLPPNSR